MVVTHTRAPAGATIRAVLRPGLLLGGVVTLSTVIRGAVAWHHSVPRYFPDEWIYTALARSIGHGQLRVDGHRALFPALIEPIAAAPLWRLFPVATAYHLVQVENALFASLAAVPIYILGRRLHLSSTSCLLCAVFALATPTLVMIPFTLTDFVGYVLVLTAVLAGQRSLEEPTGRSQVLFALAAGIAALGRTEYFVLVPAYLVAAVILDRRRVLSRHAIAFAAVAPAGLALIIASTGYFSVTVHHVPLRFADVTQISLQLFLLVLVTGIVIVPGAVVGLWRPPDRATTAFAALTTAFVAFLVTEVGIFSANSAARFRERYLFAIAPLLALSFCTYVRRRCPHKWAVFLLSVTLAIAAARIPVSAYSTGAARFDAMTLLAFERLQAETGVASTSFLVAGLLTLGGAWAILIALRGRGTAALPAAIALTIAMSVLATWEDVRDTRHVRAQLPADLEWVTHAAKGPVTAVGTPLSSASDLLFPLYWNPVIDRVLLLDDATTADQYAGPNVHPGPHGEVGAPPGDFLFDNGGTQASFSNARLITAKPSFQLWRAAEAPRYRTLVEGMWRDGWLIAGGRIRAWSRAPGSGAAVRLGLTFSVPRTWPRNAFVALNGRRWTIAPGDHVHVICTAEASVDVTYRSQAVFDQKNRPVSVRLTHVAPSDIPTRSAGRRTICRSA